MQAEPVPDRHAQIGVFVVAGKEVLVETARCLERDARHQQAVGRDMVDGTNVRVGERTGRFVPPERVARAVLPHDRAGFLQAAVRKEQSRADRPDALVAARRVQQPLQPAGLRLRVVVEKDEIVALGVAGRKVVPRAEPQIQHRPQR